MNYTWEELAIATGAEMVGGVLQKFESPGKYLVLGEVARGVFTPTDAGFAFIRSLDAAGEEKPPVPKPHRHRAPKHVELTVVDEVTTPDATAATGD